MPTCRRNLARARVGNRSAAAGLTRVLGAVLLFAASPVAARNVAQVTAGCWLTSSGWDLGGARTDQTSSGLWSELVFASGLEARLELSGARGKNARATGSLGDGVSGAVLLRYQPPGRGWLVQGGVALPAGEGDLTLELLGLTRQLAEPLLSFPDPDPVHGWRMHAGGTGGWALSRRLRLYGGIGLEHGAPFEPAAALRFEPGTRGSGRVGLEIGDRSGATLGAEFGLTLEGQERAYGEVIREGRQTIDSSMKGSVPVGTWWAAMTVGFSATGRTEWPALTEVGSLRETGPGRLRLIVLALDPRRGFPLRGAWRLQPGLDFAHRQFAPRGLPYGEGWVATLAPRLAVLLQQVEIKTTLGIQWGRWRPWQTDGLADRTAIEGFRMTAELLWRPH